MTNDQAALLAAASMAGPLTRPDEIADRADWMARWLDERDRLAGRLPPTWRLPDSLE
jgi:hypothetical protein